MSEANIDTNTMYEEDQRAEESHHSTAGNVKNRIFVRIICGMARFQACDCCFRRRCRDMLRSV